MSFSFGAIFAAGSGQVDPARPALIHGDRTIGWGAFHRRTTNLAAHMLAHGAQAGDRLAHLMRNSPAYLETTVAGFRARLVHVNINYRYTAEELFYILDNSESTVLVFDADFAELVESIRPRLTHIKLYVQVGGENPSWAQDYETLVETDLPLPEQAHSGEDMLFIYTGGTTGMPKGVMWDQADLFTLLGGALNDPETGQPAALADHAATMATGLAARRSLILPPLMHGTGYLIGIFTLVTGGTVVTLPGTSLDGAAAARACAEHSCTFATLVGDAFGRPLLAALDAGHGSIASLVGILSSGTMWSPEIKAGLLRHAPNAALVDALSSSEALGMGSSVQTSANAGAATVFTPTDTNSLILDDNLHPVADGEMGRLARAGLLPRGYWKDEAKSAATFPVINGTRYSIPGDFAVKNPDGSFTLMGRGSQCINTAGEKVFPEEVEETLKTHAHVTDALVFGVPDPQWGQAVTAVVEAPEGTDVFELQAHARQHLAGYKVPKRIVVVAKCPRAPNGKADYAGARALVG
ncbi:acyl-CoA synthetase [Polymorphobacter multimanifer]|uniref:Fatty-acyl-CoA synthase n=1 Tax=Polymorphobacter multimanifer TaxID=1070431 RepID=A0A841L0Q4_9SPHN|nr:AMP-binding protein [Polymorphobacter multimanifer]MBB6225916.1 fatty-acyl-CoA synthase [Polymorphobacter multimanifer]GGI88587.1 acyl-CoA synthetase [Polymorphobacter multimanifer]